jgi:hypothetical protein
MNLSNPWAKCGATPDLVGEFVRSFDSFEFRFQGKLGFGGKLHTSRYQSDAHPRKFYISFYGEDETPERIIMRDRANERLAKL